MACGRELCYKVMLYIVRTLFDLCSVCHMMYCTLCMYLAGVHEFVWATVNFLFPRKNYKLTKLPEHLSCAFTDRENPPRVEVLADIALYCYMYAIKNVTFYDPWSILSSEIQCIEDTIRRKFKQVNYGKCHISVNEFKKNITDDCLTINVLGFEDSSEPLVQIARSLSSAHKCNNLELKDITVSVIDNEMNCRNVGQPDLLMHFCKHSSLFGYPPWALRICELVPVSIHKYSNGRFSEMQFLDVLDVFSKRHQRFGK